MQRQKNTIDSVPENVDINSGSFPLTDGMTRQTYLSNTPDQEGVCSNDSSSSSHVVHNGGESFDAWNFPQPSFALNQGSQPDIDGREVEQDWSSSFCGSSGAGTSSAPRQLHLNHSALFPETAVSRNPGDNPNASTSISRLLAWESEHGISTAARSGNSAHSLGSSSHMEGRTGGSSSSMAAWCSSSCKRRAFEGTSGQSNPSASSSSNPQPENSAWGNGTPPTRDSPDPMNLSPPSLWHSPSVNIQEHLGPSTRLSVREASLEPFPVPSFMIGSEVSMATGNLDGRGSSGPQPEPFPINLAAPTLSSLGNLRHSSGSSMPHRPGQSSSFTDMRSTRGTHMNTSASQTTQSSAIQAPRVPRTSPSFPWLNPHRSRSGSIPSALLTGVSRDEANSGSMHRYMSDTPLVTSAAETRNVGQDSPSWDLAAGLMSHGPTGPSSHQAGQSYSSRQPLPPFVAPQTMSTDIRRALEMVPWAPEYFDGQNGHLSGLSSSAGPSSGPQGSGSNSSGRRMRYQRAALSVDRQGDELLSMSESPARAFIGNAEGRNRVINEIRQVLNAMRRGENLRAEDYTLFEPRMFQSLAEMHDRHRDMRLDVDNMSYEELLELGEQIGDVSTGLKEETILKLLKQHKRQMPAGEETVRDLEPCCICQEQYVDGEDIGELDCGHDFHTNCIKQWLMHKNLCPICKTTGLNT